MDAEVKLLTKILQTLTLSTLKLPDSGKMDTEAQTEEEHSVETWYSYNLIRLWCSMLGYCRLTTGLCNEVGEEVFIAVLLACDCCADEWRCLVNIMEVLGWGTNAVWQDVQCLFACALVALNHLCNKKTNKKNWFKPSILTSPSFRKRRSCFQEVHHYRSA